MWILDYLASTSSKQAVLPMGQASKQGTMERPTPEEGQP
jgi:hypothetical protein